jgi:hypothetical protein
MDAIRGWPAVGVLMVIALVFVVMAVLYAVGGLQIFTSSGQGTHLRHAILFGGLGVVALVVASFMRPRIE